MNVIQNHLLLRPHMNTYIYYEPLPRSILLSISSSERRVSGKERRRGDDVQSHRTLQQEEHHSAEVRMTQGFFRFEN